MSQWHPFEDGETIGMTGAEGGRIIADEQHDGGARITLERDCLRAPYAITSTVYGWLYHTRFIADEPTAKQAYDDMKPALEQIIALLPQGSRWRRNARRRADGASRRRLRRGVCVRANPTPRLTSPRCGAKLRFALRRPPLHEWRGGWGVRFEAERKVISSVA